MLQVKNIILFYIALFFISCTSQFDNKPEKGIEKSQTDLLSRDPLPYPEIVKEKLKITGIDSLYAERVRLRIHLDELIDETTSSPARKNEIDLLETLLSQNTAAIVLMQNHSICNNEADYVDVEYYSGTMNSDIKSIEKLQPSVGQLQWKYSFGSGFFSSGGIPGNVTGVRWCTGTLIGKELFITAGHCFDRNVKEWDLPRINNEIISSKDMAKLMKVNFNYQKSSQSGSIRQDTIDFPVIELKEYRLGNLDYAILKLGKDKNGHLPGDIFGFVDLSDQKPIINDNIICIQHPDGRPKVIEDGNISSISQSYLLYNDLDTESGSSGSPIIALSTKKIVGVHVRGGCDVKSDGNNKAVPIFLIKNISPIVKSIIK